MIILGDLASPNLESSGTLKKIFSENPHVFKEKKIICNFEGLIYDGDNQKSSEPLLYNHSSILKELNCGHHSVMCLANNHVLDLPHQFEETINLFNRNGYHYCGAGNTREKAEKPLFFNQDGKSFLIYNACWDFLLYNHSNPKSGVYVSEIDEKTLLSRIKESKKKDHEVQVIVFLHWNFDLETLPLPMYRRFSRDLISAGASLVVGAHSHCVQGGEKYKDGYIVYGLGNFLIPDYEYAGGKLAFPSFAKMELALEWKVTENQIICHWFEYQRVKGNNKLEYRGSEEFESSETLRGYSPFVGMSDADYLKYYKRHRRKRILIPVYKDYHQHLRNKIYTMFLIARARIAHFLAKIEIIKWQS